MPKVAVKLDAKTVKALFRYAGFLQSIRGERVTVDEALSELLSRVEMEYPIKEIRVEDEKWPKSKKSDTGE